MTLPTQVELTRRYILNKDLAPQADLWNFFSKGAKYPAEVRETYRRNFHASREMRRKLATLGEVKDNERLAARAKQGLVLEFLEAHPPKLDEEAFVKFAKEVVDPFLAEKMAPEEVEAKLDDALVKLEKAKNRS